MISWYWCTRVHMNQNLLVQYHIVWIIYGLNSKVKVSKVLIWILSYTSMTVYKSWFGRVVWLKYFMQSLPLSFLFPSTMAEIGDLTGGSYCIDIVMSAMMHFPLIRFCHFSRLPDPMAAQWPIRNAVARNDCLLWGYQTQYFIHDPGLSMVFGCFVHVFCGDQDFGIA